MKLQFSKHAKESLFKRFNDFSLYELDPERMKLVTKNNAQHYPVLQRKYNTGIHNDTVYLVSKAHNLALAIIDNIVITTLYLDGKYGY